VTLDAVFRLHARTRPDKVALIDGSRRFGFASLDRMIDGAAHHLAARGIRRGEIVGVALRDTAEHLVALLALARLGSVVLPMDCRWQPPEKQNLATQFGATQVLMEADDPAAGTPGWHALPSGWAAEASVPYLDPEVSADSPFVLSLSSGTTGLPKGPLASHQRFENRFMVYWINLGLNAHDTYVNATPLYFGGGRGFSLAMLYAGGTVSLLTPRASMQELVEHIAEVQGTALFLVPTQLRRALQEALPAPAFPSLRVLISSGSALHPDERVAIRQRLTPNLFEMYSSTEGGGISVLAPADGALHGDSVGRPAFRVEVEIVDDDHVPLPPGAVGRLRYRSPASATGYYRAEGGDAFRDGWFYPGDLARMGQDGFLFLAGRAKDMIIRGGINIYPQDVERVLLDLPGIRDACVAGTPAAEMGEEVVAFIVGETTAEAVRDACRTRLAPYKLPRLIRFVDEIPRNGAGKALKPQLLATLHEEPLP
jgi:acyl-CoA synthetase (AMP-forming)/AMP-acid ligase II